MTRKPSLFYTEKRVLAMFPYWTVILVLTLLTILSYLPYRLTLDLVRSGLFGRLVRLFMQRKGLS